MAKKNVSILLILTLLAMPEISVFAHCTHLLSPTSEVQAVFAADQSCHPSSDNTASSCTDSHIKATCQSAGGCTLYDCPGLTASCDYSHTFKSFLYTPLVPLSATGMIYDPATRPPIAIPRV
ncbi:MAG: hypothetical protein ACU85E_14445 [Gammaproteobacteria bacterium]